MRLARYWFRFEAQAPPQPLNLGWGVSAYDYDDALALLRERVFRDAVLPQIVEVNENVDVSTLDSKHILPNMEDPTVRGIWFPRGYLRL
jgi:hypothetical protein